MSCNIAITIAAISIKFYSDGKETSIQAISKNSKIYKKAKRDNTRRGGCCCASTVTLSEVEVKTQLQSSGWSSVVLTVSSPHCKVFDKNRSECQDPSHAHLVEILFIWKHETCLWSHKISSCVMRVCVWGSCHMSHLLHVKHHAEI